MKIYFSTDISMKGIYSVKTVCGCKVEALIV